MKFFTDKTVKENKYLLIKLQDYRNGKTDLNVYDEVMIDPGVYELIKSLKYSWEENFNIREFLDTLPDNHYFSADYPPDMLLDGLKNEEFGWDYFMKVSKLFIHKTWDNAVKLCDHKNYIVTCQSYFENEKSFYKWFDRFNSLDIKSGIMGIGNLCRIHYLQDYIKRVLDYVFKNVSVNVVHIYGLGLRITPYAYRLSKIHGVKLTVDNTKWTRAVTQELKESEGLCCSSNNRQMYYEEYMKRLSQIRRIVKLELKQKPMF